MYVCLCVLYLQGMGCIKAVWSAPRASVVHFGRNFIKQKLQGAPDHGSLFWTPNLDLEVPGPSVLLEPWSVTFKGSL